LCQDLRKCQKVNGSATTANKICGEKERIANIAFQKKSRAQKGSATDHRGKKEERKEAITVILQRQRRRAEDPVESETASHGTWKTIKRFKMHVKARRRVREAVEITTYLTQQLLSLEAGPIPEEIKEKVSAVKRSKKAKRNEMARTAAISLQQKAKAIIEKLAIG